MAGFFSTIKTAFTASGLNMAPYKVLRTAEGYEERLYPTQKWVKTQMPHISKDEVSSLMFRKLFQFISGQNDKGVKIAMTTPVTTLIEPGAGPNCESTFTMAFYIPPSLQEDTPQPTDPTVSIEERPEFKVLARAFHGPADETSFLEQARLFGEMIQSNKVDAERVNFVSYFSVQSSSANNEEHIEEIWFLKSDMTYGGFSNDQKVEVERTHFFAVLTEDDKKQIEPIHSYYVVGYDPPFKLFNRRNEIWFVINDATKPTTKTETACRDEAEPSA